MSGRWTDLPSAARCLVQLMWRDESVLVMRGIHSSGFPTMRPTPPPLAALPHPTLGSVPQLYLGASLSGVNLSFFLLLTSGPCGPEDHFPDSWSHCNTQKGIQ
jgi:hypothetical protein